MTALALIALFVALIALMGVAGLWRQLRGLQTHDNASQEASDLPADAHALRQEVAALRVENSDALKHLAVIRYDAFRDMGGHLSWTAALLDDHGSGLVITSIHGRSDSRTYAKNVTDWSSDQQLSPEEERAITSAKPE